MSDIDWDVWLRGRLADDLSLAALMPEGVQVFPGGSLEEAPRRKPFLIFHLDQEVRAPFPGHSLQNASVWAHDEPGSYYRIGQVLKAVRNALCGAGYTTGQAGAPNGGGIARWVSTSGDLSDDAFKTIVRYSQYQLHGGDGYG